MFNWVRLLNSLERQGRTRLRTDVPVILSGNCGQLIARSIDVSRDGIGVVGNQSLDPGTLLFVRLPECKLMGFAFVRRCAAQAEGLYRIGLQFREALARDENTQPARLDFGGWQHSVARDTRHAWSAADDL